MLYFDTSYLVRLYTKDAGWEKVRALAATDNLICSIHGRAETVAAFHRKFREGVTGAKWLMDVIAELERDVQAEAFQWLPVSDAVIERTVKAYASLPATNALRAADAIHLASVAESGLKEIYTNDGQMLAAASHFGVKGLNVI